MLMIREAWAHRPAPAAGCAARHLRAPHHSYSRHKVLA